MSHHHHIHNQPFIPMHPLEAMAPIAEAPPAAPPDPAHDHAAAAAARPNIGGSALISGLARRLSIDGPGAAAAASGPRLSGEELRSLGSTVRKALEKKPEARQIFDRMLLSGDLEADGGRVLRSLASIASHARDSRLSGRGLDTTEILAQTLKVISDPLSVQQGEGRGTCGAGTMEYLLLTQDPGHFAEIVDGITSKGLTAKLHGHDTMSLPESALPDDKSGRTPLDRLVQSAIMNRARTLNYPFFDYNPQHDHSDFLSAITGNSSVPIENFRDLYTNITGRQFESESSFVLDKNDVAKKMEAAVATGEKVPVLVNFGSRTNFHWLSAEKIDHDLAGNPQTVTLRNPWGQDDGSGDPPRKALGRGLISMRYSDFVKILDGAVFPKHAGGTAPAAPDDAPADDDAQANLIQRLMHNADGHAARSVRDILTGASGDQLSAVLEHVDQRKLAKTLDGDSLGIVLSRLGQECKSGKNVQHLFNLVREGGPEAAQNMVKHMTDAQLAAVKMVPGGKEALIQALAKLKHDHHIFGQSHAEKSAEKRLKMAIG